MSYARNNGVDSDVYVIHHSGYDALVCYCAYEVVDDEWGTDVYPYVASSTQDMIDHLREHEASGDRVPQHAFDRLAQDLLES